MKKWFAFLVMTAALVVVPGQATPAQALTYIGDWRMTVHKMSDETDYCPEGVCGTSFDIRTHQPGWEGSDQYQVYVTLDGQDLYGDAGQNDAWHVDPDFAGVRAGASTSEPLSLGVHTLVLDWIYRGVWTCGPGVPNGCSYVGREHVAKTYKFRWHGDADQTIRPYIKPASSVAIGAKRSSGKVTIAGTARAQRLTSDYVLSSTHYPVRAARVTLQSYSASKRKWIGRKTVNSTSRGKVAVTIGAPKTLKWRWVVASKSAYRGSVSKTVRK